MTRLQLLSRLLGRPVETETMELKREALLPPEMLIGDIIERSNDGRTCFYKFIDLEEYEGRGQACATLLTMERKMDAVRSQYDPIIVEFEMGFALRAFDPEANRPDGTEVSCSSSRLDISGWNQSTCRYLSGAIKANLMKRSLLQPLLDQIRKFAWTNLRAIGPYEMLQRELKSRDL